MSFEKLYYKGKEVVFDNCTKSAVIYVLEPNPVKRFILRIWEWIKGGDKDGQTSNTKRKVRSS